MGIKEGSTTITCIDSLGVFQQNYLVTVKKAPKNLTLNLTKAALFPKETISLEPTVNKKGACNLYTYSSSNKKIVSVNKEGVIKAKKKGTALITVSTYNGITATCEVRVKSTKKLVALTFDDGPVHANTSRLLEALEKYDYHATFFMLGYSIKGNEDLLKKMVEQNEEIGLHTWDHKDLTTLSKSSAKKEIIKTDNAIYKACGQHATVLRPPYGAYDKTTLSVAKKCGLPVIMWNIDVRDWATKDSAKVEAAILKQTRNGSILVLHDLHKSSVDAIINVLPKLKKKGFEVVTVSELAKINATTLKPGKVYNGE